MSNIVNYQEKTKTPSRTHIFPLDSQIDLLVLIRPEWSIWASAANESAERMKTPTLNISPVFVSSPFSSPPFVMFFSVIFCVYRLRFLFFLFSFPLRSLFLRFLLLFLRWLNEFELEGSTKRNLAVRFLFRGQNHWLPYAVILPLRQLHCLSTSSFNMRRANLGDDTTSQSLVQEDSLLGVQESWPIALWFQLECLVWTCSRKRFCSLNSINWGSMVFVVPQLQKRETKNTAKNPQVHFWSFVFFSCFMLGFPTVEMIIFGVEQKVPLLGTLHFFPGQRMHLGALLKFHKARRRFRRFHISSELYWTSNILISNIPFD